MATNNYIPKYEPSDLKWYKKNGLMTYIDQVKCEEFLSDPDKHFREKKVVNFDIIYKSIRGEEMPEGDLKKYQAVQNNRVKQYSQEHRNKLLSAAFETDRKDLYFEKEVIQSHFSSLCQKK